MRVLIGEISSYKAIVIARHLKSVYKDIYLIGYDYKPLLTYIHTKYIDAFVSFEKKDMHEYIMLIANYINQSKIDIFIPVHSEFIGIILKYKTLFGNSLDYMGSYTDYLQLHEKNLLLQIAERCSIRIPKCYSNLQEAKIPFVVKPTNQSSAKGVQYCMNISQLHQIRITTEHILIQEYIQGEGCGYDVYCQAGKIIKEYGHKRLAEYPITGGSSVLRESYINLEMRKIAEKILKVIPWTGFAMFEFKLTPTHELVLIEVNPRIWGSINQPLQNGIHFFENILGAYDYPCQTSIMKRTCLNPQVYLALFKYALHGRLDILKDYFQNLNHTYQDVSILDDCGGMLSIIIRKLL